MSIRVATADDWEAIWPIFREIVRAGETYAFDPGLSKAEGRQLWMIAPHKTYVFEEDGQILGTYFLKANFAGPGGHVCNCGYMVSAQARGRGLATQLCEHSQEVALALDYKAMQFNYVAASNEGAVRLWRRLGFEVVGRLPGAVNHPSRGLVDALVMYKWLDGSPPEGDAAGG